MTVITLFYVFMICSLVLYAQPVLLTGNLAYTLGDWRPPG